VGEQNKTLADIGSILEEIRYLKSRLETIEKSLEIEIVPENILSTYRKNVDKTNFVDVLE